MADPNPAHPRGDRALSRLIFDEVHRALRPYRLAPEDRDDVALNAMETAFDRWTTYRGEAGSLRKWIRGIVRNEVREFRRAQARRVLHEAEHASLMPTSEIQTPEGDVSALELFDHLIVQVPIEQRRIFYLVEFAKHTIREAATCEGVSVSTAHARYKAGLKAFTEAVERWKEEQKQLGLVPLPLTVADIIAGGRPPAAPDEDFERAWTRMAAKLGLDEGGPPESGPRRSDMIDEDPPSSRPPSVDPPWLTERKRALLRKVGIVLGVLGLILPGDNTLSGSVEEETDVIREAAADATSPPALAASPSATATVYAARLPASSAGAVTTPTPLAAGPGVTATVHAAGPPANSAGPTTPRPPPATARASGPGGVDPLDDEIALLDRGRTALDGGHPAKALAVCAEHARRFPKGQATDARRRLWHDACVQLRAHAPGGGPATARCAQQP